METDLKKYYQPDISEFHVGFEYEEAWGLERVNQEWIKEVFKIDQSPVHLLPKLRVKYLDREDIESCGFVCHATDNRVYHNKDGIIINTEWGSPVKQGITLVIVSPVFDAVSYTHLTLPTT